MKNRRHLGKTRQKRRILYYFGYFSWFFSTVGTKIIADLEKCSQESTSEKLLILLRDRPCLEILIGSSNFRLRSSCRTSYWNRSDSINSSKKASSITGRALSRINSVVISARTVHYFPLELPPTSGNSTVDFCETSPFLVPSSAGLKRPPSFDTYQRLTL